MKRNFDLIREILKAINDKNDHSPLEFKNPEYTESEINYNSWLILQAGLAVGEKMDNVSGEIETYLTDLTWDGHDFYELSNNDKLWKKAKSEILSKIGSTSFEILLTLLNKLATKALFTS